MSTITQLLCNKFGGIRERNAVFNSELVTAQDMQNVELFYTGLNAGVGIRTVKGNKSITDVEISGEIQSLIPSDENVIAMFESVQMGNYYFLIYTESLTQGKLYNFSVSSQTLTSIITGMSVTGQACGADFAQGWRDYFVFSNGIDVKYIYSDSETFEYLQVESAGNIHLIDEENRTVKGLGIKNFNSRLWIFNDKVLWYSEQGDCRNFTPSGSAYETDAGYIELVKNITAIYPYLGSLAVFHKDSSALIKTDSTTKFLVTEESPGGCASYNSLIFHGTELYFYDDTKKGVFSFQQVINGDKTLGNNVAIDIQSILMDIKDVNKIRTASVVTEDRNEVWFLVPILDDNQHSIILIFDYLKGEWIKRKSQKINCMAIFEGNLFSGGKKIYREYVSDTFDGEYIQNYYNLTPMNLGADNTLKVLAFPPRVTLSMQANNQFYVKYIKNFNVLKTPKVRLIKSKYKKFMYWDVSNWDESYWSDEGANSIKKLPSATFKTLEIEIYSTQASENFCIKNIEFSKIKVKQV